MRDMKLCYVVCYVILCYDLLGKMTGQVYVFYDHLKKPDKAMLSLQEENKK